MRIVIDTNVIASAIFFGGKPRELIELASKNKVFAVSSPEIVQEYQATINNLVKKYKGIDFQSILIKIVSSMDIISVKKVIKVCRDPDDDKFIACASEGKCLYIISGDKDLLSVEKYGDVEILTVSAFLELYNEMNK